MAKNKRKQGEGTIRLRSDGRWEGRIVVGYNEKGNPKTKNVTAKTKYECEEKLKALKEELGKVAERIKPDMPFGDWLDFWYCHAFQGAGAGAGRCNAAEKRIKERTTQERTPKYNKQNNKGR